MSLPTTPVVRLMMALFGALEPNPWQGRDAVLAALDMRTELAAYNRQPDAA